MTVEEKAERYDKAFGIARNVWRFSSDNAEIMRMEELFPELRESEGERIRKAILELVRQSSEVFGKQNQNNMITWLEKQGKQKPIGKMQVNEKLYEYIRNTCACIDDALSSETLADITDYLEMANHDAQAAFDMIEKQGEHSIYNVPSREVILAIWDLGNEWKELTNGSISTEYGTQLDYIQKHWHESNIIRRNWGSGK